MSQAPKGFDELVAIVAEAIAISRCEVLLSGEQARCCAASAVMALDEAGAFRHPLGYAKPASEASVLSVGGITCHVDLALEGTDITVAVHPDGRKQIVGEKLPYYEPCRLCGWVKGSAACKALHE